MAKQTAVQFLVMKYNQWQGVLKDRDIEVAKSMEWNQMKDAVMYGLDEDGHTGDWKIDVAESYYIKTFVGENNK